MGKGNYQIHDFYCINCGNKGISLMRKQGFKHEKMHRKKLYCPFCRQEVNHIECKTFEEIQEFKKNFKDGMYRDEAEESLSFMRCVRIG